MSFMRPWMLPRFTRFSSAALLALGLLFPASVAFAQDGDDDDTEEAVEDQAVEEQVGDDEIADTDASALVVFRDRLSPYGSWVETPGHGLVWVPSSTVVGEDFTPYVSSGRWELTEDGDWLWVSEYEWGAVPFHYGRWVWVSGVGWAWVPGRVYAPAWVTWRVGADGYIGWAPLAPWYYWSGGIAYYHHHHFHSAFTFCSTTHVFHHHVHTVVIHDQAEVGRAAKATRPYHEAHPTKAGTARKPAAPTLDDAGVSKGSAPKARSKGDPKALEYMKPESVRKSKEASAKMKSAPSQRPTTSRAQSAVGFTAPSVRNQRAKFETTHPRKSPSAATRAEKGTFESAPARSRSESPSSARGKSKGTFESTSPSRGSRSPGAEKPSRGSSPSSSAPPSSPRVPKSTRSKRSNSSGEPRSSAPSKRSSSFDAPSRSPSYDAPSRSSAPSTSAPSKPAVKPAVKTSPSKSTGRSPRRR